jgi:hypothetical protein
VGAGNSPKLWAVLSGAGPSRPWPQPCDEEGQGNRAAGKEHAMMFAFALALVGIAVIKSLELAANHG